MKLHPTRQRLADRIRITLLACLVGSACCAGNASAYWTSSGTGSATAKVTSLGAPTISSAVAGAETVALSWTAVSAPGSGTVEYYVTRDGGLPAGNCPTSSSHSSATSCTDTGVAIGLHQYVVTAVWRTWSSTSESKSVTVSYGQATHFQVSATSTSVSAGEADSLTIIAKDASNDTVANYTGAHALTFEGASESPGGTKPVVSSVSGVEKKFGESTEINFVEGQATVSGSSNGVMKLYKAEEAKVKVTEAEHGLSNGTGLAIKVAAGAFSTFHVVPAVGEPEAGVAFEVKIYAWDQWHNTITSYARSGKLHYEGAESSPSGKAPEYSGTTEPTFAAGEASVSGFKLYKAAATTLKVKEEGTAHEGSASFTVKAGTAKKLSLATPAEQEAGSAFSVTLTALDEWGNIAKGYTGAKTLAWSGPSSAPNGTAPEYPSTATSVTFTEGVGVASSIKLYDAQSVALTAKEGTIEGTSASFTVKAGAAKSFSFSAIAEQQAGVAFTVTLTALDTWHNVAKGYTGAKPVLFSGPSSSPSGQAPSYPSSVSFTEGVSGASSITLYDVQSAIALTAKEGTIEGTSGSFNVKAGAVKKFVFASIAEQTAGTSFSVTLTATDEWGNTIKTYTGTKTLTWSGAESSPAGDAPEYPTTATKVTFSEGAATVTAIKLYDARSTTLTVKEGTIEGTSAAFSVKATAPARFAWAHPELSTGEEFEGRCLFTCLAPNIGHEAKFKARLSVTDGYGNVVTNLGVTERAEVELETGEGELANATNVTIPSTGLAESASVFEYTSPSKKKKEASLILKYRTGSTKYTQAEATIPY